MKYLHECHITINMDDGKIGEALAQSLHWKTSCIARDPVLGEKTYFYLTTHHDSYEQIWAKMVMMSNKLKSAGVRVRPALSTQWSTSNWVSR